MISIAMTTYNGEKYLHEQIDSILTQTITDFELVVCDDCSTDSTISILNEFANKDQRVKVVRNESNLGYVRNFEKAIKLCSGDYIALSDQDDIWLPTHLEVLYKVISEGNYTLVGANAELVTSDNKDIGSKLINNGHLPQAQNDFNVMLLYKNVFQGAACIFKKDLIEKALPFPENMKYHDWWLALVASEMTGVSYVDVPILRYRQHGNNASGQHERDSFLNKAKKFFNFDLIADSKKITSVLEPFIAISDKKNKISEVLDYSQKCILKKKSAVLYFVKHYGEIYFGEGKSMKFIRVIKMFLNITF